MMATVHTVRGLLMIPLVSAACACASGRPRPPGAEYERGSIGLVLPFQEIVGDELDRAIAEWQPVRAVAVVLDVASGAILGFDGRDKGRLAMGLVFTHPWVTGSTLKTFTIGAALEEKTIALDQTFPCGKRTYGADELRDNAACTSLDAAGILAQSSNVGTSYVFDTLGSALLSLHLSRLHVGDRPGRVPSGDDDRSLEAAELAIGALATATPLQVAAAYVAIFNDGLYTCRAAANLPLAPLPRPFTPETAHALVDMLERAVSDGTGKGARIAGVRVAGMTGTAPVKRDDGTEMYYSSFVGTVLDHQPRFVALVGLEVPAGEGTGALAAAPIFAKLATRLIGSKSQTAVQNVEHLTLVSGSASVASVPRPPESGQDRWSLGVRGRR